MGEPPEHRPSSGARLVRWSLLLPVGSFASTGLVTAAHWKGLVLIAGGASGVLLALGAVVAGSDPEAEPWVMPAGVAALVVGLIGGGLGAAALLVIACCGSGP